ncbi:MAG: NAD(P)-dependent oxidoreductase [Bryobacteraceae bacterium]
MIYRTMSQKPVIVVTAPEFKKASTVFEASPFQCVSSAPDEKSLSTAIRDSGASHAIVGIESYCGPLYEAMKPGSVLARFGVGHDGIDKARVARASILCTNTPGALDESVAEHAISLLLAAARHTTQVAAAMARGDWTPLTGRELRGKTLVVTGCGPIGAAVARIAGTGFGMRVVGVIRNSQPRQPELFPEITNNVSEAFSQADFVTLHIPATAENKYFINRERLVLLPSRAWLINTARGAVVDEAALYDALAEARLGGAALDVFETEPYVPVHPAKDLRTLPNAVLAPHIGSNTEDANRRMAEQAIRNIEFAEQDAFEQMNLLNPQVLECLPRRSKI